MKILITFFIFMVSFPALAVDCVSGIGPGSALIYRDQAFTFPARLPNLQFKNMTGALCSLYKKESEAAVTLLPGAALKIDSVTVEEGWGNLFSPEVSYQLADPVFSHLKCLKAKVGGNVGPTEFRDLLIVSRFEIDNSGAQCE